MSSGSQPNKESLAELEPLFLRAITENSKDGILILGADGDPLFYNNQYLELWGLEESQMRRGKGQERRKRMSLLAVDPNVFFTEIQQIVANPDVPTCSEVKLRSGKTYDFRIVPICNSETNFTGQLITYRDTTEHRIAERQRNYLSQYDKITGLLNRSTMLQLISSAIKDATKHNSKFALISFDLTMYKKINNRHGYIFGDHVLTEIARKLNPVLAPHALARYGEDEFMLLASISNNSDAHALATTVIEELDKISAINETSISVSASYGIGVYPDHGNSISTLLSSTSMALRKAQLMGPNQIVEFSEALGKKISASLEIESKLADALTTNCFRLVYQPLINIGTGEIIGTEALLRWDCNDQGEVPPSEFLPHAEETGLIIPLGEWVLRSACYQAKAWAEMGLGSIPVSVNVSAKQFAGSDFPETVQQVLEETGIDPQLLEIELTETAFVEHLTAVSKAIDRIRAMGVKVSIDDFGTGYSSLKYLKHFKVDTLKIDGSFTQGIGVTSSDDALVKTAITMAHSLGLEALAEGVESAEQLSFLESNDCDLAQGFLFSKPLRPEEFEALFINR